MAHRGHQDVPLRARRVLALASIVLGVVTVVGVLALWPRGNVVNRLLRDVVGTPETYDARVLTMVANPCEGTLPQDDIECVRMTFLLLGGPDDGERASLDFTPDSPLGAIEPGTTIVVARNPDAPRFVRYSFVDVQRGPVLVALALVFAVAVVLLGRIRGAAALLGLAATFLLLLEFVLPAILSGHSPPIVAAFSASAMAYVALYLAHGFGPMSTIALLGTLASLLLTVVLGSVFVGLADFLVFSSEEAFLVSVGATDIDLSGVVLAGVIIGSLGAIDDMTVTQASAVAELAASVPHTSRPGLFRAGLRIGRDHVSSTVNTLFLAYAGASLPLLLLFVLSGQSAASVANREVVAMEIVRTLVGSIGLVASVPLTTWLASFCYTLEPTRAVTVPVAERTGAPEPTPSEPEAGDAMQEIASKDLWIPERRIDLFRKRRR
jgi:uncharacterized membrane protein